MAVAGCNGFRLNLPHKTRETSPGLKRVLDEERSKTMGCERDEKNSEERVMAMMVGRLLIALCAMRTDVRIDRTWCFQRNLRVLIILSLKKKKNRIALGMFKVKLD